MPADFPSWDRVYAFFRRWRDHGLVTEFHDRLPAAVRTPAGRDSEPTAAVIDSQSVTADAVVGADSRGSDGGTLINRRKLTSNPKRQQRLSLAFNLAGSPDVLISASS